MNTLLVVAIAMAGGLLLSRLMKLFNLPNVTGYLIAGILIGPCVTKLLSAQDIKNVGLLTEAALGFIAFSIGGEFKLKFLKKVGGKIIVITVVQALFTVIIVTGALLLLDPNKDGLKIPRALLLGAIAAATAPAATLLVVRQYKAKGAVTDTLLPVTAFDDAIGLIVFSVMFALAEVFSSEGAVITVQAVLLNPLREIGLSLLIGGAMGALLALFMRFFKSNANRLSLMLMCVFACVALADMWELSSLLTCMMLGAVFANLRRDSVQVLELTENWTPALFMAFFVFSGAGLDFRILLAAGIAGIIYIVARSLGKYFGAFIGSSISKAEPNVRKYLGVTLLPQAGVAIGMAQLIAADPLLEKVSGSVVTVALFATLVYELAGPLLTKAALTKAGEISPEMNKSAGLFAGLKRKKKHG